MLPFGKRIWTCPPPVFEIIHPCSLQRRSKESLSLGSGIFMGIFTYLLLPLRPYSLVGILPPPCVTNNVWHTLTCMSDESNVVQFMTREEFDAMNQTLKDISEGSAKVTRLVK